MNQINWRAALLEAFFLVMGIVLAVTANNWRESNRNQQRAETALQTIREELSANREKVNDAIVYHSSLMDTLYKHMRRYKEPAVVPGADVFSKGFINPADPLSSAWEAATATGITEYMPFEQVLLISQVYKNQEQYDRQSMSMGQQIYGRMFDEGTTGILKNYKNLAQLVGAFLYTECGLSEEYQRVLPQLGTDSLSVDVPTYCQYIPGN